MQLKPKSNSVVTHLWDMEAGTITFRVKDAGDAVLDMTKVHPDNVTRAAYHGFTQRGSDGAAIPRSTKTGLSATPQEKLAAITAICQHYMSGSADWRLVTAADGGRALTVEAIARVKGVDYDTANGWVEEFAKAKYEGDTKKALAFLRDGARVREAMDAIRSERTPAAKVDADAALEEFAAVMNEAADEMPKMEPQE